MSFNSRLGSSNVHRGRPSNKSSRDRQGPPRTHEDAQPNELLRKRDVIGPPTVRSSAPQHHRSSRGHHSSRGRGNAQSPRRWSVQGTLAQSRPWGTLPEKPSIAGIPHASAASQANVVPLQHPLPPVPLSDPVQGPVLGTERQGQSTAEGIATAIHSSVQSIPPSGTHGSSSSCVNWPPRKRRKVERSDSGSHNHRRRESPPTAAPSANFRLPSNDSTISSHGQTNASVVSASAASSSSSLASASDILLTDITLPPDRNTVTPLIPIPKRLKTIPPSAAAPASSPSPSTSDNAATPSAVQEIDTVTSTPPSSASPPPLSSMQVKLERSPSPSLAPRLVTEGCIRIAPLPPECRNKQPNFQAARQRLAAAEMKRLRTLGLQIVRIFTREDGMVIDWKSPIPVLWDTLRPPPPQPAPGSGNKGVGGAGTTQSSLPPKPVQPPTTQAEYPDNRPKKRKKLKALTSGVRDGTVLIRPPAGSATELTSGPQRIAGPSQNAAASVVSLSVPALPRTTQRREPTPPRHVPPTAKKTAARPSVPRPSSVDLREGGLFSFSIPPSLQSNVAGPIQIPRIPHSDGLEPGPSRATHQLPPATEPSSRSLSKPFRSAAASMASSSTLPPAHTCIPPPVRVPAPPISIGQEDLSDAALDFLERYLHVFTVARPSLISAYAPTALFSLQIQTLEPEETEQYPLRRGPNAILAELTALPPSMTLCEWPTEAPGSAAKAHKVQWDVGCVPGSASGDVLVVCYALQEHVCRLREHKGKGKQKERAPPVSDKTRTVRWSVQQRFVLRRRDQDAGGGAGGEGNEADRIAAALWPLVAVSHQMRVRELP